MTAPVEGPEGGLPPGTTVDDVLTHGRQVHGAGLLINAMATYMISPAGEPAEAEALADLMALSEHLATEPQHAVGVAHALAAMVIELVPAEDAQAWIDNQTATVRSALGDD